MAASLWYVNRHLEPVTEPYHEIHKQRPRLKAGRMAVMGYLILLMLLDLLEQLRKRAAGQRLRLFTDAAKKLSPYALLSILTLIALMVFSIFSS